MLSGRVALITGSTSGIGWEIARRLAREGAAVVLNGFPADTPPGEQARTISNEFNVPCIYHDADLTDADAAAGLVKASTSSLGSVDILVNNAGIQYTSTVTDFPVDRWDKIIALNLSSAFYTSRVALPDMTRNGWGRVINVASVHGKVASVNKSAYVAAKHGTIGFTKALALETAAISGVTANCVCPGFVRTPLVDKQIEERSVANGTLFDDEAEALVSEKQPSGEFVQPSAIADACVFLCSTAADQMTGQSIVIDGGWTAQ